MTELGHFPMSENPAHFRKYLLPVLDRIYSAARRPIVDGGDACRP
jgi:hypothetical protein